MIPNSRQNVSVHRNVWEVSLRHAAGDIVRPTLLRSAADSFHRLW